MIVTNPIKDTVEREAQQQTTPRRGASCELQITASLLVGSSIFR
ncbi:hypothetical protein RRSWK_03264 [Rhodopirellula sp. SWK7]|nr:hypothetical protein RRSWK_03264 [Rhodopirellula sp. SWK7]